MKNKRYKDRSGQELAQTNVSMKHLSLYKLYQFSLTFHLKL